MSARWSVSFTACAASHVEFIQEWWSRERPLAPQLFEHELAAVVERLAVFPGTGATWRTSVRPVIRRTLLPASRYHVYYTADSQNREVVIRAVWHACRGQEPKLG